MSASFPWKISRSQTPSTSWEPHETAPVNGDTLTPDQFWKWVDMCKDDDDFGISDDESHTHETADEVPDHAGHRYHFELDSASVFDQQGVLGHGQLGSVAKMKMRGSDIIFACKTSTTPYRVQKLRKEAALLKDLNHEHIVKFIGTFTPPGRKNYLSLIMFPVGEQNLEEFLRDAKSSEHQSWLKGWFICLASALCYLHNKGIRHEDIKPSNIIHCGNRILFTDFGSSTEFKTEITTSTDSPASGSPMYEAPEVIDRTKTHGARSDIFSLGCVYVELLTTLTKGNVPELHSFCKEQSTNAKNPSGSFLYSSVTDHLDSWFASLRPPVEVTIIWKDIIQLMLREERKERPTAIETLKLLQAGFIPLVMANDRKCCNPRGHELISSRTPHGIQSSGRIFKKARHSIQEIDSVRVNFHRLERLRVLIMRGYDAIDGQPPLPSSAGFVEICFVNTFVLQKSWRENQDLLQVMFHYRMNLNAYGGKVKGPWPFKDTPGYSWKTINPFKRSEQVYPVSMLQAAAWWGHKKSVRLLLENGADPNAWNEHDGTALHAAAWQGHTPILKALLNAGADPRLECVRFDTCLCAAAHRGHSSVVQTLIDAGVDVNQTSEKGRSPISAAVRCGDSKVIRMLICAGADLDFELKHSLSLLLKESVRRSDDESVQDLLEAGVDPNERSRGLFGAILGPSIETALIIAASMGKTSLIRRLYKGGAELDHVCAFNGTALIAACKRGELESVRILIQLGTNVNIDAGRQGTAHAAAYKRGHKEIVQLLEEAGAQSTA